MVIMLLCFFAAYIMYGMLSYDFHLLFWVVVISGVLGGIFSNEHGESQIAGFGFFYAIALLLFIAFGGKLYHNAGEFYVAAVILLFITGFILYLLKLYIDGEFCVNGHSNDKKSYYDKKVKEYKAQYPENYELIIAQFTGTVISLNTKVGNQVKSGQTLMVIEAAKMSLEVMGWKDGKVSEICCSLNQKVKEGDLLAVVVPNFEVKQTPIEKTENGYVVHDKYGNSVNYYSKEQADAFQKLQGDSINQMSPNCFTTTNGEITKEWYKSIGNETVNIEQENDDIVEDTSAFLSSSNAFLEDAVAYYEEFDCGGTVPEVKHYLPIPAKDDYKRPVPKKTTYVAPSNDERKIFVEVKFPYSRKTYDYICDINGVQMDDYVLVPAGGEQKEGRVVGLKYRTLAEMPLPSYRYKKVISKCVGSKNSKTEPYYVLVAFEEGGKEYTYKCDLPNIRIGDFVRVKAQGVEKTVRVEDVVNSWERNIRSKVLRLATDDEAWLWRYPEDAKDYDDDDDDELEIEPEPDDDDYEHTTYYQPRENISRTGGASMYNLYDDDDDDYKSSSTGLFGFKYESMTDERGFMRNGKAEEYEAQMRKAERLGRMTDDRGFMIDPYYAQRLRENFAYDEMYSNGEVDEEESCNEDDDY